MNVYVGASYKHELFIWDIDNGMLNYANQKKNNIDKEMNKKKCIILYTVLYEF